MAVSKRTTEKECPDCSGFHRCDYHEGMRHGRQEDNGRAYREGQDSIIRGLKQMLDETDEKGFETALDATNYLRKRLDEVFVEDAENGDM